MDNITQAEYFKECRAIATEIVKECDGDEETIQDKLHETIKGHQWIIYTFYNLQVLTHSRNENAYFDEFGVSLDTADFSSTMAKLAYFSMMTDVQYELSEALESYKAEERASV